jgi:hypothetical protein
VYEEIAALTAALVQLGRAITVSDALPIRAIRLACPLAQVLADPFAALDVTERCGTETVVAGWLRGGSTGGAVVSLVLTLLSALVLLLAQDGRPGAEEHERRGRGCREERAQDVAPGMSRSEHARDAVELR